MAQLTEPLLLLIVTETSTFPHHNIQTLTFEVLASQVQHDCRPLSSMLQEVFSLDLVGGW